MKVGATKLAPPEMTTKATMRVICFDEFGGPDVLKLEEIPLAEFLATLNSVYGKVMSSDEILAELNKHTYKRIVENS